MKKILCGVLLLLALCAFGTVLSGCRYRYSRETDPQKYLAFTQLSDGTYAVDGFADRKVKDLVIPAQHNGASVTKISERAFCEDLYWNPFRDAVKTLTIEDGIREIGDSAFYGCVFEEVSLPDSIESVGAEAFYEVPAAFALPVSVKAVGAGAFRDSGLYGAADLRGVEFDSFSFASTGIVSAAISADVPESAFYGCVNLAAVTLEEGVQTVGEAAFRGCTALCGIEFPDSLTDIGTYAFANSGLTEVTLPLQTGERAFADCKALAKVTLAGAAPGSYAFNGCTALDTLVLSDFTQTLDAEAFVYCPLNEIKIQGDCTYYALKDGCLVYKTKEDVLFMGGSGQTDLSAWREIGPYAFAGRNMGQVRTGGDLETINPGAFRYATIEELDADCETIESHAFHYTEIGKANICAELIANSAFYYTTFRDGTVTLEEGCKYVQDSAFSNCKIKTLYLPASLVFAGKQAFSAVYLETVYYALAEGTPPQMDISVFRGISSVWEDGGRYIEFAMPENFAFYVHEQIYDYCKAHWAGRPNYAANGQTFVFQDSLSDFLKIY